MLGGVPALSMSDSVPRCGRGGCAILCLPVLSSAPPPAPWASIARVVRGFSPPPAPISPPPTLHLPRWPLRGFCPPREMILLLGRQCPAATQLPLPLPGGPPRSFSPLNSPRGLLHIPSLLRARSLLRRPRGPPLRHPLRRNRQLESLSLAAIFAPLRSAAPAFSTSAEVAFPVSPSVSLPPAQFFPLCSGVCPVIQRVVRSSPTSCRRRRRLCHLCCPLPLPLCASRLLSSIPISFSCPPTPLRRLVGSYGRPSHSLHFLPWPQQPILPVRTKMLAIGQEGVRHAGK